MNAFRKRQILIDSLKDNRVDIVAIQETKKEHFQDRTLRSLSSYLDIWEWLPSRGRSGGILFGCTSSKFELLECHSILSPSLLYLNAK